MRKKYHNPTLTFHLSLARVCLVTYRLLGFPQIVDPNRNLPVAGDGLSQLIAFNFFALLVHGCNFIVFMENGLW
ncbi:Hypothetical predicted protein [Olea europaea subsp. europaea]|uniref:Uncharacterized protein n=1 Tax=Olea europaea subsp. europaea TaxID=158383 RepID=A0A8S0SG39_OLEEU|nr:Hypothetical predicted protein [Olea europaea subsp. europaea]